MGESTTLVTGGTGFLGGWCVVQALERGHDVRTTVRDLRREDAVRQAVTGAGADPGDRLSVLAADLTSDDGLQSADVRPAAGEGVKLGERPRPDQQEHVGVRFGQQAFHEMPAEEAGAAGHERRRVVHGREAIAKRP